MQLQPFSYNVSSLQKGLSLPAENPVDRHCRLLDAEVWILYKAVKGNNHLDNCKQINMKPFVSMTSLDTKH